MNRKEKGWMAEACVKAYYHNKTAEMPWNLSPQEPAADLLLSESRLVIEVKFGRDPTRLKPDEKSQIAWRALWCAERDYHYRLWHTDGKVPPSTGRCYRVLGLERSPNRKGYRLRVFEEGQFALPKPGVGQVTRFVGLPPLLPPHAESRAVEDRWPEAGASQEAGVASGVSPLTSAPSKTTRIAKGRADNGDPGEPDTGSSLSSPQKQAARPAKPSDCPKCNYIGGIIWTKSGFECARCRWRGEPPEA